MHTYYSPSRIIFFLLSIILALTLSTSLSPSDDPYTVLGVRQTASANAIKEAYRRKAKETHPDKNPGIDPEKFRKVAEAFEILSDSKLKRQFDQQRQNRKNQEARQQQKAREQEKRRKSNAAREWDLKKSQATKAQVQVRRFSSLEELWDAVVDAQGRLTRSLLLACVGGKKAEQAVDSSLLFPYPVGGTNEWEGVVLTAKVRYNAPTDLARFFKVPTDRSDRPHIVFVRKGNRLSEFAVFDTNQTWNDQKLFQNWVIAQLTTRTTFVNQHDRDVHLFLVEETIGETHLVQKIKPRNFFQYNTRVGQTFAVRDARVDNFPNERGSPRISISNNSTLEFWTISNYNSQIDLAKNPRRCVDVSSRCSHWTTRGFAKGPCEGHSLEFMRGVCPRTCELCGEAGSSPATMLFGLKNLHVVGGPGWIYDLIDFVRIFAEDMEDVLKNRLAAACLLAYFACFVGFEAAEGGGRHERETGMLQILIRFMDKVQTCGFLLGIVTVLLVLIIMWQYSPNTVFVLVWFACMVVIELWTRTPKKSPMMTSEQRRIRKLKQARNMAIVYTYLMGIVIVWRCLSMGGFIANTLNRARLLVSDLTYVCTFRRTAAAAVMSLGAIMGLAPEIVRVVVWVCVRNVYVLTEVTSDFSTFPGHDDIFFAIIIALMLITCLFLGIDMHTGYKLYNELEHIFKYRKNAVLVLMLHGLFLSLGVSSMIKKWIKKKNIYLTSDYSCQKTLRNLMFFTYAQCVLWCLSHTMTWKYYVQDIQSKMSMLPVISDMMVIYELRKVVGSIFFLVGFSVGMLLAIASSQIIPSSPENNVEFIEEKRNEQDSVASTQSSLSSKDKIEPENGLHELDNSKEKIE